jgi:DnaJ like chaperone protein
MSYLRSHRWIDRTLRVVDAPALMLEQLRDWLGNRHQRGQLRHARVQLTTTDSHDNFREMAFTFAIIALAAKLAEADGTPSRDEFITFREIFPMPASEHEKIRRLFALATRDGAKVSAHARRIATLFPPPRHRELLCDVLARLCRLAMSDGRLHAREEVLLEEIARCFRIGRRSYQRLVQRVFDEVGVGDPYGVLGAKPDWSDEDIRKAYYRLMREYHPDGVQAQGGSADAVLIASRQMAQLNSAYNAIRAERRD